MRIANDRSKTKQKEGAPANTTIDAGAIKGRRKSKSWAPDEKNSSKLDQI